MLAPTLKPKGHFRTWRPQDERDSVSEANIQLRSSRPVRIRQISRLVSEELLTKQAPTASLCLGNLRTSDRDGSTCSVGATRPLTVSLMPMVKGPHKRHVTDRPRQLVAEPDLATPSFGGFPMFRPTTFREPNGGFHHVDNRARLAAMSALFDETFREPAEAGAVRANFVENLLAPCQRICVANAVTETNDAKHRHGTAVEVAPTPIEGSQSQLKPGVRR